MRIIKINDRYFLADTQRDFENVALKLLNERRTMNLDEPKLKEFIEYITDEQDGDLAIDMVARLYDTEVISPEIV